MNEAELFSSGTMEAIRRKVEHFLDDASTLVMAGVIESVVETLTDDDCNPHGLARPLIVNNQVVLTCQDCEYLFTSDYGDIDDKTQDFQCYTCRDETD